MRSFSSAPTDFRSSFGKSTITLEFTRAPPWILTTAPSSSSAVKSLREQLEDLNLFNAKLLYVNKLLQNKGLTEAQRKSVIRALDKAGSLNEAKTLYKSLTESFSEKGKTLSESRHRGSSSRATTPGSSNKTASSEVGRWAKLAGLK